VQPSEDRKGNELGRSVDGRTTFPRDRRLAIESLMWSRDVVVVIDELAQQSLAVPLAEDDDVVEHLAP